MLGRITQQPLEYSVRMIRYAGEDKPIAIRIQCKDDTL